VTRAALDFADESYVRLFTRDTKTWLRLGFEGQAVLMFVLRKLDRAGVLDGMDDPESDLALVAGIPLDLVKIGLPRLLERGVLQLSSNRLIMPNFLEAQNCRQSDRLRKQESRTRRRDDALDSSPLVTSGHPESPPSPLVTPILADPIPTKPSLAHERESESTTHRRIPKTWKPSEAFYGEALSLGVTRSVLDDDVTYWRARDLGGEFHDFEEFFRSHFSRLRKHRETEQFKDQSRVPGSTGTASYTWAATDEARKFAKSRDLDLAHAVDAYRAGGEPERLPTLDAHLDFLRRLKCWAATGVFHPKGPLPKRSRPANEAEKEAS
jgi:hypothetical protein